MKPPVITQRWRLLATFLATLSTATLVAAETWACGGFFCSNIPVEQSGEQIIFEVYPESVRATIQINYTGPAPDFAWVIPTRTVPTVSIGSDTVFQVLRQKTDPVFQVDVVDPNGCGWFFWDLDASAGGGGPPNADGGGEVEVVAVGVTGPYQFAVVKSDDPFALNGWLQDNDYDQPPESLPLIAHYVAQGNYFLALKLSKDKGTGDIVPIVLELPYPEPCVPLILTSIAATPDMPVNVWLVGESRAIPHNWMHVQPNLKKLDWMQLMANGWWGNGAPQSYTTLVTDAIDEAGGRAFTTQYGSSTESFKDTFYKEGQYDLEKLAKTTSASEFVKSVLQMFTPSMQLLELLRSHIPMPESLKAQGVSENSFYSFPDSYESAYATISFDPVLFAAALDETIVTPLKNMQTGIDTLPYLTRIVTLVSPDEMTRDPIFNFNPDLGDVSNVIKAKATIFCDEPGKVTGVEIELPDGAVVTPGADSWFGKWPGTDYSSEPAAKQIELLPTSGPAKPVAPNEVSQIDQLLGMMTTDDIKPVGPEVVDEPKPDPPTTKPWPVPTSMLTIPAKWLPPIQPVLVPGVLPPPVTDAPNPETPEEPENPEEPALIDDPAPVAVDPGTPVAPVDNTETGDGTTLQPASPKDSGCAAASSTPPWPTFVFGLLAVISIAYRSRRRQFHGE